MIRLQAVQHCSREGVLPGPIEHIFEAGKIHVLCGPNGVGKSTLLRHLAGLLSPTSGQIWLDNRPLHQFSIEELACRRILLPQKHPLTFALQVEEVVALGATPFNRKATVAEHTERVLSELALTDFIGRAYTHLSGGEQQRVQLARAFVQFCLAGELQQAHFALFDEALNGLDLVHQQKCIALLRQSVRSDNAIILALHDLSLAATCADSVVLMQDGQLLAVGEPEAVLTPERVAAVFGVEAYWHKHPRNGEPVLTAQPMICGLHKKGSIEKSL